MLRLLIPSFLIMAWAFYELSGGEDFEPVQVRRSVELAPAPATEPNTARQVPGPSSQSLAAVKVAAPAPKPAPQPVAQPDLGPKAEIFSLANTDETDPGADTPVTRLSTFDATGTTLSGLTTAGLSALASGNTIAADEDDEAIQEDVAVETDPSIRKIAAARVNVRGGPGTGFSVVAKLDQGTPVRVVGEPLSGWLMLRTVENDLLGYVAANLVSPPNG
ncbi:SH3 domain-containing protein [Chachezhania antarctica]|uniref:SH3 domain-containing protein n=1 Tax=Chachezhania antarctica TaxID=2340860 RepID=UPI000EB46EE1|nr:SH3 domain-containing protein [Chachezhania antarctica]|tara:strand:- start:3093 stop:3749 length:657 start_codon:yes stop_codon:yes gene_type:complete